MWSSSSASLWAPAKPRAVSLQLPLGMMRCFPTLIRCSRSDEAVPRGGGEDAQQSEGNIKGSLIGGKASAGGPKAIPAAI
jgi:hypothetical protein